MQASCCFWVKQPSKAIHNKNAIQGNNNQLQAHDMQQLVQSWLARARLGDDDLHAVSFSRQESLMLFSQQGSRRLGGVGHDLDQLGGSFSVVHPLVCSYPV